MRWRRGGKRIAASLKDRHPGICKASTKSRSLDPQKATRFPLAGVRLVSVALRSLAVAVLACGLVVPAMPAAIQTKVCSNAPAVGERVECPEDRTSTDDIVILPEGVDIDIAATADLTRAVHAKHEGGGEIDVWRSTFRTQGRNGFGISGEHRAAGAGDIGIEVRDTTIQTAGQLGFGINAGREIGIESHGVKVLTRRNSIPTEGNRAYGIWATDRSTVAGGSVAIDSGGDSITTNGSQSHGVFGYQPTACERGNERRTEIDIDLLNASIKTSGHGLDFQGVAENQLFWCHCLEQKPGRHRSPRRLLRCLRRRLGDHERCRRARHLRREFRDAGSNCILINVSRPVGDHERTRALTTSIPAPGAARSRPRSARGSRCAKPERARAAFGSAASIQRPWPWSARRV